MIDTESVRKHLAKAKRVDNHTILQLLVEVDETRYRLDGAHKKIRLLIQERDVAEDRLRAAQSQGAV